MECVYVPPSRVEGLPMNLAGGADRKLYMKTLPTRIRLHASDTNVYNVSTMMPRIPETGKTCPVILAENFRCGAGRHLKDAPGESGRQSALVAC